MHPFVAATLREALIYSPVPSLRAQRGIPATQGNPEVSDLSTIWIAALRSQ